MTSFLRLVTESDGSARFEAWDPALAPEHPGPGELSASVPLPASACLVIRAPAGGGHPEQPEAGRRLVVVLSVESEVIASGRTVVGRPGDVLLVEDTTGIGHASRTTTGFEALMVVLAEVPSPPPAARAGRAPVLAGGPRLRLGEYPT